MLQSLRIFPFVFEMFQPPDAGELCENPARRCVRIQAGERVLLFIGKEKSLAYLTHSKLSKTDGEQKAHPRL